MGALRSSPLPCRPIKEYIRLGATWNGCVGSQHVAAEGPWDCGSPLRGRGLCSSSADVRSSPSGFMSAGHSWQAGQRQYEERLREEAAEPHWRGQSDAMKSTASSVSTTETGEISLSESDPWYGASVEASSDCTSGQRLPSVQTWPDKGAGGGEERETPWRPTNVQRRRLSEAPSHSGEPGAGLLDVDWTKCVLPPIQPNAHSLDNAVLDRSPEEVAAFLARHKIRLSGADPLPRPLVSFAEANLPSELNGALHAMGLREPTPIQSIGWPSALCGRDVIAISQTGSGKTVGFLVPAILHWMQQRAHTTDDRIPPVSTFASSSPSSLPAPCVLVLAPTRELAVQIHSEACRLLRAANCRREDRDASASGFPVESGSENSTAETVKDVDDSLPPPSLSSKSPFCARSAVVYGGAPRQQQVLQLRRGADIVIATPGRFVKERRHTAWRRRKRLTPSEGVCMRGTQTSRLARRRHPDFEAGFIRRS